MSTLAPTHGTLDGYLTALLEAAKAEGRISSGRHLGRVAGVHGSTANRILGGDWRDAPKWSNVKALAETLQADMDTVKALYKDVLFEAAMSEDGVTRPLSSVVSICTQPRPYAAHSLQHAA